MKNKILLFSIVVFVSVLALPIEVAAKENEWVRVPSKWLLHRFVRPSTAPARTYRVALVVPPGSKHVRVAQSSGNSDVDQVAADFALESILNNGALKDLAKSKELYFQFVLTPPMLDIKMRSVEGQRPAPAGKDFYTPTADTFYTDPNQNETTSRRGELVVIFPPGGGHAVESIVTISTGNPAVDRYFLHSAVLNWQTTRKSSQDQILRYPFGATKPTRWQSILDQ